MPKKNCPWCLKKVHRFNTECGLCLHAELEEKHAPYSASRFYICHPAGGGS